MRPRLAAVVLVTAIAVSLVEMGAVASLLTGLARACIVGVIAGCVAALAWAVDRCLRALPPPPDPWDVRTQPVWRRRP